MPKNNAETLVQGNQVTYKRYFDVPVELAFEAWSSPLHLSHWWEPDGFTLTTSIDFSQGGFWEFTMHGPDGHDYENKVQFLEIRAPFFIRYKHLGSGEGDPDVDFEARVHFEEFGNGTNLTFEQIFSSQKELERVNAKYGAVQGAQQHIGSFCQYALNLKSSRKEALHA
jgi:uncharacterized protein YndB with AHSA1/START domain